MKIDAIDTEIYKLSGNTIKIMPSRIHAIDLYLHFNSTQKIHYTTLMIINQVIRVKDYNKLTYINECIRLKRKTDE